MTMVANRKIDMQFVKKTFYMTVTKKQLENAMYRYAGNGG